MVKEVNSVGNPCRVSARYTLAVLGCVGLGIIYGLKVNLHVAIVSMVNHTALAAEADNHGVGRGGNVSTGGDAGVTCAADDTNSTGIPMEEGPFAWPSTAQGVLLSAYFWGYLAAQFPGARAAELFSAKWTLLVSVAANVLGALLTPAAARLHLAALGAVRVIEGAAGGATFPAMHVLLARWAPPGERGVMSSVVYAGTALGTVIFMLVSGLIAGSLGWEAVFYIEGGASLIWLVLWAIFVTDTPQTQRFITEEERSYILTSLNQGSDTDKHEEKHKIPWKSVFTSPAFLAILVAHTCSNWGWYMVLIELPLYMKSVLNLKISENAVLTALPFLCMWIFSILLSKVLDTLRGKQLISTTVARKTATGCASFIPMICFIALSYIGCQKVLAIVLMTVAVMSIGGMYCGFLSNHIDIAPNFAGTLMALTNTVATLPGIIVPVFVGKLTDTDPSIRSWRIIFWTTVAFYVVEILVYMTFGSGEEQTWNNVEESKGELQPLKSKKIMGSNNKELSKTDTATA